MNPMASRPTEATSTTTAQPGELDITIPSRVQQLEVSLQEVDRRLKEHSRMLNKNSRMLHKHSRMVNENSRILIKQNRTLNKHSRMFKKHSRNKNKVLSSIEYLHGRLDPTETQPLVRTLPSEAIPQRSISVQSPWPLAPTPGPLATGPNTAHTLALHAIGFDVMQTLVPPTDGFNISHTHARPTAGPNAADNLASLAAGLNAAYTPILFTSGFGYVGTLAALAAGFDAAKFSTGPAVLAHTSDSDAAPASTASYRSASPSTAQPPPKRHKARPREGRAIVQSPNSETGVSSSDVGESANGQNRFITIIRDSSGHEVTAELFSELFGLFIFICLDIVPCVFNQIVSPLKTIKGFEVWSCGLPGVDSGFVVRRGPRYEDMRQRLYRRLRLAEREAAVPAPVMFYHPLTLGYVYANQLFDITLAHMFERAAGCKLNHRRVISTVGPIEFSVSEFCRLAQGWLLDICEYIINDDRMNDLLTTADNLYEEYKPKCGGRVDAGAVFDPDGSIGKVMLQSNKPDIELVLSLRRKDFLELYKFLPSMTDGVFVGSENVYLKLASRFVSTTPQ